MNKKIGILVGLFTVMYYNNETIKKNRSTDTINDFILKIVNEINLILSTNDKNEKKEEEIFKIFDNIVDIKLVAKISLGKYFKEMTAVQRNRFYSAFKKSRLFKGFIAHIVKLPSINITNILYIREGKVLFNSILDKNNSISIEVWYIVYKNLDKNNSISIFNVIINGISLINIYNMQFTNILSNNKIDLLIEQLENSK